jgi:Fe-S-cluster containining protein
VTDSLKAAANKAARNERKTAHLRAIMDRYADRFRSAGNHDAPAVALEVHAAIEVVLERDRQRNATGGEIQCRKGCSHCCRGPVEIWPQEAALLVAAAREAGVELDEARLARQSRHTVATWREQPAADRACAFLGDHGECKVYASRPNACRKLLVTSDPGLCDTEKNAMDRVERWFSWEAEILETAAQEAFGSGLMPRLLLDALSAEDQPQMNADERG